MSEVPLPPTFTADDLALVRLLDSEPDDWTKKCFGASFVHLSLAHRIREVDPAMALLRAITAEEEAASGLLRALRTIKYPSFDELRPKDHLQKAAVYPFIRSIVKHASYLRLEGVEAVKLGIPKDETPARLQLALVLSGENAGYIAQASPPLNLRVREADQSVDYRKYFLELLTPAGFDDIRKYLDMKKNERNLLLYASPRGLIEPEPLADHILLDFKSRIMVILQATLLIWPYREIQPLVQEAVTSFLEITGQLRRLRDPDEV